ncbi:reverse transcriptase-like protein [Novosphingobium sp.]|uniref:reverse transcriptase-like protein n=1 Tax=Novosphingobium sp. TaxID=1874826 RepID=UPI0038BA2B75
MKIWFDGGCRPNPGPIETAVVAGGRTHYRADHGQGDNSDAEWLALIVALELAHDLGVTDVVAIGDSTLVVAQASGAARRIAPRFAPYLARFHALSAGFARVRLRQVRRGQNLAGIALDARHNDHLPPS